MIIGRRKDNLSADLVSGEHKFISDVPAKLGGRDEGPGPHELLEAALAACTIITLQMYANRKQMKLESADVVVNVESESTQESKISRKIELKGDLTQDQRKSLIEIANKCPIHKLLSSHIVIETSGG